VGITLTEASLVVFAELHWTPGILVQAEDRAHRIGQKSSVNIQYLLAAGTIDDVIWRSISRKVGIVSTMCDGRKDYLNVELCVKGPSQGIEEAISQTGDVSQRPPDSMCESLVDALAENDDATLCEGRLPERPVGNSLWTDILRMQPAPATPDTVCYEAAADDEIEQHSDSEGEDPIRERFKDHSFSFSRLTGRVHILDACGKPRGANVKFSEWEERGCSAYPEALSQDAGVVLALEQFLKEWKALTEKEQRQRMDQTLRLPLKQRMCKRRQRQSKKPSREDDPPRIEKPKKVKEPSPKQKKKEDEKAGWAILERLRQKLKKRKAPPREHRECDATQEHVEDEEDQKQVDRSSAAESSQCTVAFQPGILGLRINASMVTRVHPESQADKHGINVGWKLLRIDDRPFEDAALHEKVKSAQAFTLTFQPKMCASCGEAATEADSEFCSPACALKGVPVEPAKKKSRNGYRCESSP